MAQDTDTTARSWHDMGGFDAGPVPQAEHNYALWEKRVDAVRAIASASGYFTVDGLRRALEDMGPDAFAKMSYYERWMAATCQNLIAEGVFSIAELNDRMAAIKSRGATYGDAQGHGE